MTGIDELRRTLADHATEIADTDLVGRSASVQHRVAVVRRRRRAAVASGAVAVMAVVGGVALLPERDGPEPADRTVVGVEAPEHLMSLDYTYAFDRSVEGKGRAAAVDLEASDEPRLVTWATSGDDDEVTIKETGAERRVSVLPDFDDFVLVTPGEAARVRVEAAAGRVGLAIYELTDQRPDGFTEDGITFRQDIEGRALVGAEIGEPGESDITLDVSTPKGGVSYAQLCVNAPEGSRLRVQRGSGGYFESGCDQITTFDPGPHALSVPDFPASDEPARLWVVDESGDAVVDPDIRLGIGVYQDPAPEKWAAGQPVPLRIEGSGHRWSLSTTMETRRDVLRWRVPPPDGPRWVKLYVSNPVEEAMTLVNGRAVTSFTNRSAGPAAFGIGPVDAGADLVVEMRGLEPGSRWTVVTYVRED